ncbi:MAG: alkaline phosphatase family protein [Deltaproteobacteria bacterium]|nr:alkaline phosphatase family protein [Deltaproteobacteria bacterium]
MGDKNGNKVLVIGLDGATFDLIDPWIAEGRLPNLAQCLKNGTRSALLSTPLSNSAQAWSSFITGKNAGKHGIYDFFETRTDSYGVRFLNASFRKGKSLWRLVSESGGYVGVMNVPITYPPEEVNGFLIPGLDSPGIDDDFAYPKGLMRELKATIGGYILEAGIWGYISQGRPDKALEGLLEMVRTRTAAAKYLMENKPWDLFVMVYTATDKVQHHFWKYIDPSRPESRSSEEYAQAIRLVYEEIDKGMGQLLASAGDASVIIMSDHGAGPSSRRTMYINRWLYSEGFLHYSSERGIPGALDRIKYGLLERTNNEIKRLLPRKAKEMMLRLLPGLRDRVDSVLFLPGIDWSRTVAYSRENHPAIFINTKGREAQGIVEPGAEYERVRAEIIQRLKMLKCPQTGLAIAGNVTCREEVYHGPEAYKGPDIIFEWRDHRYVHRPSGNRPNGNFLEVLDDRALLASENTTRPSGIHRDYGIFVGSGGHFREKAQVEGVTIYDLAPTVLYLLGIPIPEDMDGTVIREGIDKDYLDGSPVQTGGTSGEVEEAPRAFDIDETEAVKQRLQGLGYID